MNYWSDSTGMISAPPECLRTCLCRPSAQGCSFIEVFPDAILLRSNLSYHSWCIPCQTDDWLRAELQNFKPGVSPSGPHSSVTADTTMEDPLQVQQQVDSVTFQLSNSSQKHTSQWETVPLRLEGNTDSSSFYPSNVFLFKFPDAAVLYILTNKRRHRCTFSNGFSNPAVETPCSAHFQRLSSPKHPT